MSAVYTIPAGAAFADTLAKGLLARFQAQPLKLAECLILLPTRRACRTLREAFLRQSGGKALLLPRLVPLGDLDADELALTTGAAILPAIAPRRRQLLLAQLVAKRLPELQPAQHLAYARQLGRLLDDIAIENADPAKLEELAGEYSQHWQITLEFLRPVLTLWPAILQEEGAIDSAVRRNQLLEAQAQAWQENPPQTPVIAAGMTGVIPAIATLLKAVLQLPQGEIVLPGLPTASEAHGWWDKLDENHPHYGLCDLLTRLDVPLTQVALWPGAEGHEARRELLHTALLPAAATASWANLPALEADGITRITCASVQEEATLIAYLLRGVLETPGRTGTLITADRNLGRRVAQALRRWGLGIDNSAGTPLAKTENATFLRLLLAYAEKPDGYRFLSLMKHPFMLAGLEPHECRTRTRRVETELIRGYPRMNGIASLLHRITRHDEMAADEKQLLTSWLADIQGKLAPLLQMVSSPAVSLTQLLRELVKAGETLSSPDKLWRAEAGEALAGWIADLLESARDYPPLPPAELSDVLLTLMSDVLVRLRYGDHPRLTLLGPLEARLQSADLVILAGLNEGNWPAPPEADPWMSRPMRREFGLKSPEQRLGEEAHDFYTLAASPEVVLCRAERQGDAPGVPARWLRRLDTLFEAQNITAPYARGEKLLAEARLLDQAGKVAPISAPNPCPPIESRPKALWVTDIEKLRRDPYQIYAKLILGLRAQDDIEPEANVAERGSFIHEVLRRFIEAHKEDLPADPLPELLRLGEEELAHAGLEDEKALWWPRFIRAMQWFMATEREVRTQCQPLATEATGSAQLPSGFVIKAKADRIDLAENGKSLAIIDYKTGTPPSDSERRLQVAVQLPLEAYIALKGGFKDVPALPASELSFWRLSGGDPPGERKSAGKDISPTDMMREAVDALEALLAEYAKPETTYPSEPLAALRPRYSDYRHLARTQEWANAGEEDDSDDE